MSRDVLSDEAWAVIGQLFRTEKSTGRPPVVRCRRLSAAAGESAVPRATGRRSGLGRLDREDQIAHRCKRPRQPIDFGEQQRLRYRGRNIGKRWFNKLKQSRGIAMRSDKPTPHYHSGPCLAAPTTGKQANPQLEAKVIDIVALNLDPPENAVDRSPRSRQWIAPHPCWRCSLI